MYAVGTSRDPFWQERESTLFRDGDREGVRWWGVSSHAKIPGRRPREDLCGLVSVKFLSQTSASAPHACPPLPQRPSKEGA